MSFWGLSGGDSAAATSSGEFDAGGGNNEPIPDGTTVLAMPDDVKWAEDRNGNEHLSIRWTVLKPEAYQGRKVFHKLWVSDEKPGQKNPEKYRDKALMMLAAIDKNAGGKLGKNAGRPTDDQLAVALVNKQMTLRLGVWEMDGDNGPMSGNWVQQVADKTKPVTEVEERRPVARSASRGRQQSTSYANRLDEDLDDDVPF